MVDEIIEELRQDGPPVEMIAETLFGFGCYVGEVRRASPGRPPRSSPVRRNGSAPDAAIRYALTIMNRGRAHPRNGERGA
jgi:hypothetical protein